MYEVIKEVRLKFQSYYRYQVCFLYTYMCKCYVMQSFDFRSSRPEVLCKIIVLKNFAKYTRKHLCQSLFFNNVAGLRRFPVNFAKLRTLFFIEQLRQLLPWFPRFLIYLTDAQAQLYFENKRFWLSYKNLGKFVS